MNIVLLIITNKVPRRRTNLLYYVYLVSCVTGYVTRDTYQQVKGLNGYLFFLTLVIGT